MPSPNGYIISTSVNDQYISRNEVKVSWTYDATQAPWPVTVNQYSFKVWNSDVDPLIDPLAFNQSNVYNLADGCVPQPGNPFLIPNTTDAAVAVGDLDANTQYWFRIAVWDENDVEVDSWITEPYTTPDVPVYVCLTGSVTPTSATLRVGAITGELNVPTCIEDQTYFDWGTVSGGPYPNTEGPIAGQPTPSAPIAGLTPGTTYYYRARTNDAVVFGSNQIAQSQECSFTTPQIAPLGTYYCGKLIEGLLSNEIQHPSIPSVHYFVPTNRP